MSIGDTGLPTIMSSITTSAIDLPLRRSVERTCDDLAILTLVVVSIITHAWIGLWTVCTDYIKPVCIRTSVILFLLLAEAILLVWGLKIVWGI